MAATPTLTQRLQFRKSAESTESPRQFSTEPPTLRAARHGVVTLFGYGIKISVERGHLMLEDGIGADRHRWRFSRVGHGLRRLVVIGNNGFVSLSALRFLADQGASFLMLERDGCVLLTTGPVRSYEARLRRAQALAFHSGAALQIARELISQKLAGQEQVVRDRLHESVVADTIGGLRAELANTNSIPTIRLIESQAALAYWSTWHNLAITFPRNELHRVPDHWLTFGARVSPLTGSPRLAVNPPNAILNYLYALLESEARLATAALGLDPALGVLHSDTSARDSLACDVMEAVRPQVDAFVLDWIRRAPAKRELFFEQRDGNCRLMGPLAAKLSETAPMWRHAVAPIAESVARTLWSTTIKRKRNLSLPTRLTQRRKREAKGAAPLPPPVPAPVPQNSCRECGAPIAIRSTHCPNCNVPVVIANLVAGAVAGRVQSKSTKSRARLGNTQRRHNAERRNWKASTLPEWLNQEVYDRKIRPLLKPLSRSTIMSAIGVSKMYASDIRSGKRRPHQRHWQTLARLVGVVAD
jgi:CRISPR-associated endonuclease Cas1